MQDEWSSAHRPNFLMGGMGAPYKPGESSGARYTKDGAAALRMGRSNEQAAADLRSMLYKSGESSSPANVSRSVNVSQSVNDSRKPSLSSNLRERQYYTVLYHDTRLYNDTGLYNDNGLYNDSGLYNDTSL